MVVILSEDAIPAVRMCVDEYLEADLPDGHRYELVDGVVEMAPAPDGPHDTLVTFFSEQFLLYRRARPSDVAHVSHGARVPIPDKATVREPDLALYRQWDRHGGGVRAWKERAPFLVVEIVSPGQGRRDLVDKREDYRLAGIEEYWVADPEAGRLTVFRRGPTAWEEETFDQPQATYAPVRLPGLEISIGALFGHEPTA